MEEQCYGFPGTEYDVCDTMVTVHLPWLVNLVSCQQWRTQYILVDRLSGELLSAEGNSKVQCDGARLEHACEVVQPGIFAPAHPEFPRISHPGLFVFGRDSITADSEAVGGGFIRAFAPVAGADLGGRRRKRRKDRPASRGDGVGPCDLPFGTVAPQQQAHQIAGQVASGGRGALAVVLLGLLFCLCCGTAAAFSTPRPLLLLERNFRWVDLPSRGNCSLRALHCGGLRGFGSSAHVRDGNPLGGVRKGSIELGLHQHCALRVARAANSARFRQRLVPVVDAAAVQAACEADGNRSLAKLRLTFDDALRNAEIAALSCEQRSASLERLRAECARSSGLLADKLGACNGASEGSINAHPGSAFGVTGRDAGSTLVHAVRADAPARPKKRRAHAAKAVAPVEGKWSSAFRNFDGNGDGYVAAEELRAAYKQQGEPHGHADVQAGMRELDSDRDGVVSFAEFAAGLSRHERGR